MNEQRLQAYHNLIQQLLACPDGEKPQILNQAIKLVDEGFVQVCEQVAQQLRQAGEENQDQFLRSLAQQLGESLNRQPSGGGGESKETPDHATAEDYLTFLIQVLKATEDSQGNPSLVYPLLQQNLDKLDLNLAQILQTWNNHRLANIDPKKAHDAAVNIGIFSTLMTQFPEGNTAMNIEIAIVGHQVALSVFSNTLRNPYNWALTQISLANAYQTRIKEEQAENLEQAIACYEQALQIYTYETFPEKWADTQNNLGGAYRSRIRGNREDNIECAIKYFKAALKVRKRSKNPYNWAMTQHNIGETYRNHTKGGLKKNIERAIHHLKLSLTVRILTKYPQEWAMTKNSLGEAYRNRVCGNHVDNLKRAIACFDDSLKVYKQDKFPDFWATALNNMGCTICASDLNHDNNEKISEGIRCFELALKVRTRTSLPHDHTQTLFNLGLAYRNSYQLENAYKTFASAIDTVEEIRSGIMIGGEADKQKLAEEWQELYQVMVEVCLELENSSAALEYAERSKARNLVELMAATRLKPPGVSAEVWERYDALSQQCWNLQQQRDSSTFSPLSKTEITQQLIKLRQDIDTLVEEEITAHDPKFRFGQQVQSIPYREIQALVDDNTVMVEWYSTRKGIHAFIVTRQGEPIFVSTDKDAWNRLGQLTNEYLKAYYTNNKQWQKQLPFYLQRLAAILELDQLLSRIPSHCQELILVPYRFLHLFPLHALPVSETEYLSDKFPQGIRYAPSSQILQLSLSQDSTPLGKEGEEKSLFAIQNPTGDLYYTNIEVEAIQTQFNPLTVLKGDAASKTGFNQAATQLKDAAFVHFSCHGSFDFANPRNSGLIFADAKLPETAATETATPRIRSQGGEFDAIECLTLPEIFNLRFRQCRLVTLSACETGITDIRTSSDEYISILAGFFFAGSRNVLGTLWAVNDLSTAIFMIRFYETLLGENQPPVALAVKQTQEWMRQVTVDKLLEWIAGCPLIGEERRQEMDDELTGWYSLTEIPFQSPYYWSAFCSVGQ
ncbi:CHAT domain-containing protein [Laspinema sp. A4]|uniref:CHAT domain-containing protein n=1 Tax=Laspinema sp. D2d TaxID=2953686 RepID=UPI0021BA65F4|nr:CHAT domain-containing protein [Laspinema sp. D2d]MCT7986144.1 CHAT domain-containing protein [Laspinema sp. D2d]